MLFRGREQRREVEGRHAGDLEKKDYRRERDDLRWTIMQQAQHFSPERRPGGTQTQNDRRAERQRRRCSHHHQQVSDGVLLESGRLGQGRISGTDQHATQPEGEQQRRGHRPVVSTPGQAPHACSIDASCRQDHQQRQIVPARPGSCHTVHGLSPPGRIWPGAPGTGGAAAARSPGRRRRRCSRRGRREPTEPRSGSGAAPAPCAG